jgi:hypothetical protein
MRKRLFHIFLALLTALVSLANAHKHDDSAPLSFDVDSHCFEHCAACELKSVLQNGDVSPRFALCAPAHYKFCFQPSLSTVFIDCSLFFISLRAPPEIA